MRCTKAYRVVVAFRIWRLLLGVTFGMSVTTQRYPIDQSKYSDQIMEFIKRLDSHHTEDLDARRWSTQGTESDGLAVARKKQ